MIGRLKNNIYRFYVWLDDREYIIFLIMISVIIPNVLLVLSKDKTIFVGCIISNMILLVFYISRVRYVKGFFDFDKSKYNIPVVGELVSVDRDFYYDNVIVRPSISNHSYRRSLKINKSRVAEVINVVYTDGDWDIHLEFSNTSIIVQYFESRKYWKTRSDVRNDRLKEIGI